MAPRVEYFVVSAVLLRFSCNSIILTVQSLVNKPQVTLSATFRIPGKPMATTGSTVMVSPSSPSSTSSSILRTQLSSPLLQTTINPLTAPSVAKLSQAPSLLTQLKQQQPPVSMDQGNSSSSKPFNRNTNNNVTLFTGLLGKHTFHD